MKTNHMASPTHIKFFKAVDHDPFTLPDIQLVVPAIQPQLEIFASCLMGGEDANRSYNESVSLRLLGTLNLQAMLRALQDVVQRHEALRSSFTADGTQVFIRARLHLKIDIQDFSEQTREKQVEILNEFRIKEAQTSFDLMNGPLIRVSLFKLGDAEQYLTLTTHHIVCDGWSLGILMQDLSKYYSAYTRGIEPHLSEAPRFSRYAIEQWEFAQGKEYDKIEKYWLDQYKNSIPVLSVPTDFPRPALRTYRSSREDFKLSPDLVSDIKKLGAQTGCSFVTTLLSLFELYIHRLCDQDDIVVGLPAAGQSVTGNYGLIGHCVNLLPLRSTIEEGNNFLQYLQSQKSLLLDAFEHQQITFGSLLQKLPVIRDQSRIPLIPVVFNVDMGMDDGVVFEGLQHELISNPRAFENFEIFVNASGSEHQMAMEWSYNTRLFKASTISAMMRGFEDLIREVSQNPLIRLFDISTTNHDNTHTKNLLRRNDLYTDYPKQTPVHQLISEAARDHSGNPAVYFQNQVVTYQQLNETANQLAAVLIENGLQQGDIVGVALERSHKMVIALLAIMKAGAAYLPVDPEYPKDRIHFLLEDSSPKIVLTSKKFEAALYSSAKLIVIEEIWPGLKRYPTSDPPVNVSGSDLVYILYTSGSTGKPKGVKIAHHNLSNFLHSFRKTLSVNKNDKFLGITTLAFDISGLEIYLPLVSGASVTIIPGDTARDGNLLLEAIRRIRPTIMQATPTTWQFLLEAGWDNTVFVQTICSGGEALAMDLAHKLIERCDNLYNLYGPTETTIWSALKKVTKDDQQISIGHPIDNTQIYILDSHQLPVSPASSGEIYIAGEGVAKGYLKRPEMTEDRFLRNPFSEDSASKMYRTGDMGRILSNGEIQYIGRIDHQIKIRGYRIEPDEIQDSLMRQNDIKACVVTAMEDGAGDQNLVAYVVPRAANKEQKTKQGKLVEIHKYKRTNQLSKQTAIDPFPTSDEQIQKWKHGLREWLPSYMIPNVFILLESLPLTPNGKIDRKGLPLPDISHSVSKKSAEPSNPLEASLIEMWKELLRIQHVGIHDKFFEIGGHSLLAMRLISALRREMAVEIPLIDIFDSTVQTLAAKIGSLQRPDNPATPKPNLSTGNPGQTKLRPEEGRQSAGGQQEWVSSEKGRYMIPIKEDGTNIPLFGIISFYSYRILANYLTDDQPLYYFPPTRSASVKEIASHFVKEIKATQPTGPYCIGGFCEGGTLALEIAQQLQSQGDTVSALLLFEFYSPAAVISKRSATYIKRRLQYYKNRLLSLTRAGGSPFTLLKNMIKTSYYRFKVSYLEPPPPKFILSREYEKYVYQPYSGNVVLFKAGNPPLEVNDSPLMGWSEYFTGNVELITVDGGHLGILREPAIQKLAQELNVVLEKLNDPVKSTVYQKIL